MVNGIKLRNLIDTMRKVKISYKFNSHVSLSKFRQSKLTEFMDM